MFELIIENFNGRQWIDFLRWPKLIEIEIEIERRENETISRSLTSENNVEVEIIVLLECKCRSIGSNPRRTQIEGEQRAMIHHDDDDENIETFVVVFPRLTDESNPIEIEMERHFSSLRNQFRRIGIV